MRQYLGTVLVPIWLGLSVTGGFAASAPDEPKKEIAPAPAMEDPVIAAPRLGVQTQWDLDLKRWPEDRFYENMTALVDSLSKTHGSEGNDVLMDIAELYLGQMMVYEAGSVLEEVADKGASDPRRLRALQDAQMLLSGDPIEDIEESPLLADTRDDREFWLALQAIGSGDPELLAENIEPGLIGMVYQTRPIAKTMLPLLTEALIESKSHELAAQALRLMDDFPELSDGSVGYYLRGRASQVQGNDASALEAYFEAANGWDRYAVRGRLALADMALSDSGRGALLAAMDVLEHGMDAWKGDHFEVLTLQKLVEVYSANGRDLDALITNGKIMLRFPNSDAALAARDRAEEELASVYQKGASGELPLSRWLTTHYRLVPAFRYYDRFPSYVEFVGDHLMDIGGATLAAQEYQRAINLIEDFALLQRVESNQDQIFTLKMKRALAFEKAGRLGEAKLLLENIKEPTDMKKMSNLKAFKSRIYAKLGDSDGLLSTQVPNPTSTNIRDLAKAFWRDAAWPESVEQYQKLWAAYPGQFDVEDATYLLIAAHKNEDSAVARRVAEAFPNLTESENWASIAESLVKEPAAIMPLSLQGANNRMNSMTQSLERLSNSGL